MTDRKGESTQVNITGNERPSFAWQDGYSAHSSVNSRDVARFWAKVRQAPNGCWEWTASRMGGRDRKLYGQFTVTVDGKQVHVYAHRFAWQIFHGPIPAGHYVCHACDNGICVRHLFLGTQFDNMRDASEKGHLNVPRRRTRVFKVEVIDKYLGGGATARALAAAYGISRMTVHRWIQEATGGADQRYRSGFHRRSA